MKKMRESLSGRQSPIRSTLRGLRLHKQQRKGFLGKSYHLWILEEFEWKSEYNFLQAIPISQEDYPSYTKAFDHWRDNRVYDQSVFPRRFFESAHRQAHSACAVVFHRLNDNGRRFYIRA